MTQEDVAARGLTYRYYQELERGQRNPTLKTLFTLAQILGTTVAALVETEPPTKARARPHLHEVEANPPRKGRKPKQPARQR